MAPIDPDAHRVFITGFTPFEEHVVNPSWQCVAPLHDTVIPPEPGLNSRPIHITSYLLDTSYSTILDSVPGFHAVPPQIPPVADPAFAVPPPPAAGYDFILHVGLTNRTPIRLEIHARKTGYKRLDATGSLPPFVPGSDTVRGLGAGYERFPDALVSDIDGKKLAEFLHTQDIPEAFESVDAGYYCCEFTLYTSLAQSTLAAEKYGKAQRTPVLFLHDAPTSTARGTRTIQKIVQFVCSRL